MPVLVSNVGKHDDPILLPPLCHPSTSINNYIFPNSRTSSMRVTSWGTPGHPPCMHNPQPTPIPLHPPQNATQWTANHHAERGAGYQSTQRRCAVSTRVTASGLAPVDAAPTTPSIDAAHESLHLLEWHKLCGQVARFCETTMAAEAVLGGDLPIGSTPQHSRTMQRETTEAMHAGLKYVLHTPQDLNHTPCNRLQGAVDIRPSAPLSLDGCVLSSVQLATVATTLHIALHVDAAVQVPTADNTPSWPALAAAALPAAQSTMLQALVASIRHCIQEHGAGVLDRASPALEAARSELRTASQQQTTAADQWAKRLHAGGAAERPQVVVRRDRLCVPVKAGRRGDLPSGSVLLGSSNSGNTLYMEPAPLVELNNAVALLRGRVDDEQLAVLQGLSAQVAAAADALRAACALLVHVDVANARAAHARWSGGVAPTIVEGHDGACVKLDVH